MKRKELYASKKDRLGIMGALASSLLISSFVYFGSPSDVSGITSRTGVSLTSPYVSSEFNVQAAEVEPVKELTQKQEIMNYIISKFGDDGGKAIAIVQTCENSKFDPKATNWNRNGTWDTGIFQVNQVHGYTLEEMQNWKKNVDAAHKIYVRAGNKFTPWTCATKVGEANYLGQT